MNIFAEITGIKYNIYCASKLDKIDFSNFNINSMPASCIINDDKFNYGISKWVSPKRTRSYPFERVYNTLLSSKRITIIPIIKDEGFKGDRDFIQWDTVSLMSLLDVYVILSYYREADKHKTRENKITNQKFDNDYVNQKIIEISNYHSSALHWNLKEIKESLSNLISKVKKSYSRISNELDIKLHNDKGIDRFQKQFLNGVTEFMETSRQKAKDAQNREQQTIQPKEALSTQTKATITIKNYLGGVYYFTTDEIELKTDKLFLIEGKHSKNSKLPSLGDIKDGLLKMILYTNLKNVQINNNNIETIPVLKLTSSKLVSSISSKNTEKEILDFFIINNFSKEQIEVVKNTFRESNENNFIVLIKKAD